ncbi:MAG: phosphosulfolactate synthase [Bacteroidetes bacterium]|nr:phosphosulfolactate synthase [Bacteroidota bacterium]
MNLIQKRGMDGVYEFPVPGRTEPPRTSGLTMVIDMGSGIVETRDLLDYAGRYIDILKISSGTAALYSEAILRRKVELIRSYGIEVEAGGSHYEIANWKGTRTEYFRKLIELGINVVEVADGHLPLSDSDRLDSIKEAKDMGLRVATEVGKKDPRENIKAPTILQQFVENVDAGSDYIIIEGKASGMDVGIFDEKGNINEEELSEITAGIDDMDKVIWEAPLRMQEQALILRFGPNVNLGNIFPQEVYPLELMRNGLMLMPLINAYHQEQEGK